MYSPRLRQSSDGEPRYFMASLSMLIYPNVAFKRLLLLCTSFLFFLSAHAQGDPMTPDRLHELLETMVPDV